MGGDFTGTDVQERQAGSCLVALGSCLVALGSCLVALGSCLVALGSCLVALGSCLVALGSCLVALGSCLVALGSCLVALGSCLVARPRHSGHCLYSTQSSLLSAAGGARRFAAVRGGACPAQWPLYERPLLMEVVAAVYGRRCAAVRDGSRRCAAVRVPLAVRYTSVSCSWKSSLLSAASCCQCCQRCECHERRAGAAAAAATAAQWAAAIAGRAAIEAGRRCAPSRPSGRCVDDVPSSVVSSAVSAVTLTMTELGRRRTGGGDDGGESRYHRPPPGGATTTAAAAVAQSFVLGTVSVLRAAAMLPPSGVLWRIAFGDGLMRGDAAGVAANRPSAGALRLTPAGERIAATGTRAGGTSSRQRGATWWSAL